MFGLAQKFGTRDAPNPTGELLTSMRAPGDRNYWWATAILACACGPSTGRRLPRSW
jgi:hypothetical protein